MEVVNPDSNENIKTDNIFAHIHEKNHETKKITSFEFFEPENDQDFQMEYFVPGFLGHYPSSSPTNLPLSDWLNELTSDKALKRAPSLSNSTSSRDHYSAEALSAMFASSCPSLPNLMVTEDLDENQENYSKEGATTSHTPLVKALQTISPFRRKKTPATDGILMGVEGDAVYAIEALTLWMIISVGLGIWFLLLVIIRKIASTKHRARGWRNISLSGNESSSDTYSQCSNSKEPSSRPRLRSIEEEPFEEQNSSERSQRVNERESANNKDNSDKSRATDKCGNKSLNPSKSFAWSNLMRLSQDQSGDSTTGSSSDGPNAANENYDIEENISKQKNKSLSPSNALTWSTLIQLAKDLNSVNTGDNSNCNKKEQNTENKGEIQSRNGSESKPENEKECIGMNRIEKSRSVGEEKEQQEPQFAPVLPVMSDLSMPPGLSKSFSSNGSDWEEKSDEVSQEVLPADDIYTGNASATAKKTTSVDYLSYCVDEPDSEAGQADSSQYCKDSKGSGCEDSLLVSSQSISSTFSMPPSIAESSQSSPSVISTLNLEKIIKRNYVALSAEKLTQVPPKEAFQRISPKTVDEGSDHHTPTSGIRRRTQSTSGDSGSKQETERRQNKSRENPSNQAVGKADGEIIDERSGAYSPNKNLKHHDIKSNSKDMTCHPSLKHFQVRDKSVKPSNSLAMLSFCDDSNTTINLLTDSSLESSDPSSNEIFKEDENPFSSPPQGKRLFEAYSPPDEPVGIARLLSPVKLRFSRYTSDAVTRKRQLEAFATTIKENIWHDAKVEGDAILSSRALVHEIDPKKLTTESIKVSNIEESIASNEKSINDKAEMNNTFQQVEIGSVQPMTEDLEALLIKTEYDDVDKTRLLEFIRSSSDSISISLSQELSNDEMEIATSCVLGSYRGQRLAIVLSCMLIILSVILLGVTGIADLRRCKEIFEVQFDDLMAKVTSPFDAIDKNRLGFFLTELSSNTMTIYDELDRHCPKVSPSLCKYISDEENSISISSSSCDLDNVPLGKTWSEWLDATGKALSSSSLSSILMDTVNDSELHQVDPNYTIFRWFITALDDSTSFFSEHSGILQNKLEIWSWAILIVFSTSVALACVSMSILFALVHPIAEKSVQDNQKKKNLYLRFGRHHVVSSLFDRNVLFSFCTRRMFAIIFWILVVASWLLGMAFTNLTVIAVDICGSEEPNSVVWKLLDQLEDSISDTASDGTRNVNNTPITDFWKHQLHNCGRQFTQYKENDSMTFAVQDVSSLVLESRIEDLLQLAEPTQTLSERLESYSSVGIYADMCGRSITSVLEATHDMSQQVCNDVEVVAKAYLELTSCDHSSWLPLYNSILNDTVCTQGLRGLAWVTGSQILILASALVVWTFRSVFLGASGTISVAGSLPVEPAEGTGRNIWESI